MSASNYDSGWAAWTLRDWAALDETARRLKLDPNQLGALIHKESSGRSTVWGGDGKQYFGLIQFGPGARKSTGIDPAKHVTPADQMPYLERYLLGAGFKPGQHGIEDAYSSVLAGAPGRLNWKDSNGTSAANSAKSFLPGGENYNVVAAYRKPGKNAGFQNTSSTTDLSGSSYSGGLDVTIKPFDFDTKLMQTAMNAGLASAAVKTTDLVTPMAYGGNSTLSASPTERIGARNTPVGNRAVTAYAAIEGQLGNVQQLANKNLGKTAADMYSMLNAQDEYNQKIDMLKNTLTGSSSTNDQMTYNSGTTNTHTFITGNTGRSTGPHLDLRVKMLDTKTGKYVYDDPNKYAGYLTVNNKPINKLFPVTSAWNEQRSSGPHNGIDYGTPVGTQVRVPDQWKFAGRFWDEGGGGWVNEYITHTGKRAQLLHGADTRNKG